MRLEQLEDRVKRHFELQPQQEKEFHDDYLELMLRYRKRHGVGEVETTTALGYFIKCLYECYGYKIKGCGEDGKEKI